MYLIWIFTIVSSLSLFHISECDGLSLSPLGLISKPSQSSETSSSDMNGDGQQNNSPPLVADGFSIQPTEAGANCAPSSGSSNILVAVVSAPKHKRARDVMRATLANSAGQAGMDTKFFCGKVPEGDQEVNDSDIDAEPLMVRLPNLKESYHNLPYKASDIFTYAYNHCYDGVIKIDDDTFVDVPKLIRLLSSKGIPLTQQYAGNIEWKSKVVEDKNSKWFSYDQYPHEFWPPYANGPGVFLGREAIKKVVEGRDQHTMFRVDDAGVGVWLQGWEHIVDISDQFSMYKYNLKPESVFVNPVTPSDMQKLGDGDRSLALEACQESHKNGCLCYDAPWNTVENYHSCWQKFTIAEYDPNAIPRLLQINR